MLHGRAQTIGLDQGIYITGRLHIGPFTLHNDMAREVED